jgi:acyl carrier protein
VHQELHKFIIDNFTFGIDGFQLCPDDSLIEKGLIDSTGILELIAFLEGTYGIEISDEDIVPENLDSINSLVRFVRDKRKVSSQLCK